MEQKTQKLAQKMENFFWAYLWINPILDIVSGVFIAMLAYNFRAFTNEGGFAITPSLVVRMLVLVGLAVYILVIRDWKAVKIASPMIVAFLMSVVSEFLFFGQVNIMSDVQYFAKFGYNIAILLVYTNVFVRSPLSRAQVLDKIHKAISISLILLTLAIEIPFILGVGYTTYADRFGFRGTRGFFYSGNDITGAFMMLLPLALCYYLHISAQKFDRKTMIFHGIGPAMTILCMALIGTKTAFLAIGVTLFFAVGYALWQMKADGKQSLRRLGWLVVMLVVVMLIISGLSMALSATGATVFDTIRISLDGFADAAEESTSTLFFSGRTDKFMVTWADYSAAGPLGWIFGIGRGMQEAIVEMDVCEVFLYYGVFGLFAMLWLYVKLGVEFLIALPKKFNLLALGAFISLGLAAAYLIVAGHVLFTVTSGFYFAFTLVYAQLAVGKMKAEQA